MLMKIWIYGWAYLFIGLELLDKAWEKLAKVMDSKPFAGAVLAANVAIVCKMMGWW